jgi:phage protein D
MMTTRPIYQDQDFYVPRFEIKLQGQDLADSVIRDVTEVTYSDTIDGYNRVEFKLHDWDNLQRVPKFSSPYDQDGQIRRLPDNSPVPVFDPGANLELRMGYYGVDEPPLMLTGQIATISPSFPATGAPILTVNALSLLYTLQRHVENMTPYFENKTYSEIAEAIGRELDMAVEIPPGQQQDETPVEYILLNNEYPIVFLMRLARRQGYDLYLNLPDDNGEPTLYFGRAATHDVTYELEWGKSLINFTPTVKVKGQVSKVIVRGWNPLAEGDEREITGEATLADLDRDYPDPQMLQSIDSALAQTHEEIVDEPIETQEQADERARSILEGLANELITAKGTTIGLPDLRAGRIIAVKGLGHRYDGRYFIKESRHIIGSSGYRTEFDARMEGSL